MRNNFDATIPHEFTELVELYNNAKSTAPRSHDKQFICVETDGSKLHGFVIDFRAKDSQLTEFFNANPGLKIERMLCVWSNGGFDMPSYDTRKYLCDKNAENKKAKMLLVGTSKYIVATFEETM